MISGLALNISFKYAVFIDTIGRQRLIAAVF